MENHTSENKNRSLRGLCANFSMTSLMNSSTRELIFFRCTLIMHKPLVRLSAMVALNHVFTRRRVLNDRLTVQVVDGKVRAINKAWRIAG